MTRLRKMMLEELQRRNYSKNTVEVYIRALKDFAAFCTPGAKTCSTIRIFIA
jgi:hypothetical protein